MDANGRNPLESAVTGVEEWVLMIPLLCWKVCSKVIVQQRVTACLSISACQKILHVQEIPEHPHVSVEEPERVERETQLPRKGRRNT